MGTQGDRECYAYTAVAFTLFQFETTVVSTICYTCHQQDDDEYCQLQRYK